MGFLRDAAFAAIGYGVSELVHDSKSKPGKTAPAASDRIEDIVDDYARRHDVFGYNNDFYRRLMRIAEKYHDVYHDDE